MDVAGQEPPGQVCYWVGLLVEGEVAGVEDVDLGIGYIAPVCFGFLDLE